MPGSRSKLPDYLAEDLRVVICGTAAGTTSAARGHYYAGRGNEFWQFLYRARLTSEALVPSTDARVLEFGIGLTDLAKDVAASNDRGLKAHYDAEGFVAKIEQFEPLWVAFHGKEAAKAVSRALGHGSSVRLGEQSWRVAGARAFVLPNASAANRDATRLEGKTHRVEWFKELASRVSESA